MQPLTFNKNHFGQIAERLRIRLDLANFKCQHGYQDMDFYSIESVFRPCLTTTTSGRKGTPRPRDSPKGDHHYYPIYHHDNHLKKKKKHLQQQQQQQQPSLGGGNRSCTIPAFLQSPPLSAKRSTSPSRTDELTAQLLLWLCHSSGNAA